MAFGALAAGLLLVVAGAEIFFDGLLASARRARISAFALMAVISGLELENLAAGISATVRDLPGAAAGTFLGGTTFLALGALGAAAVIRPFPKTPLGRLPAAALVSGLLFAVLAADGVISRIDGAVLVVAFPLLLIVGLRGREPSEAEEAGRNRGSRRLSRSSEAWSFSASEATSSVAACVKRQSHLACRRRFSEIRSSLRASSSRK